MKRVKFNWTIDYEVNEQIVALEMLIEAGGNVTADAINYALEDENTEVVKLLIKAGVDLTV